MKTTETKINVTKLIVAKTTTLDLMGTKATYKAGRVLETIRHKHKFYYVWDHVVVIGHGANEVIPAKNLKVKWFIETKTTTIKAKPVKVGPLN